MRNLEEISDYVTTEMFKNPSCKFLVVVATEKQRTILVDSLRFELKEMTNPNATKKNSVISKYKGEIRVMLASNHIAGFRAGRAGKEGFQGAMIMYDVSIHNFNVYVGHTAPLTPCFVLYPVLDDRPSLHE